MAGVYNLSFLKIQALRNQNLEKSILNVFCYSVLFSIANILII